jgi:hypothetical protein
VHVDGRARWGRLEEEWTRDAPKWMRAGEVPRRRPHVRERSQAACRDH